MDVCWWRFEHMKFIGAVNIYVSGTVGELSIS